MTSATASPPSPVSLDLEALFKRSWRLFAQKPVEHVVAGLVVSLVGTATLSLLFGPLLVAYIRLIERQRRGEDISVAQVFDFTGGLTAFIAWAVVGVAVLAGAFLFVLPSLLAVLAWGYAFWFIAAANEDATTALVSSWRMLRRHFGSVAVVWVVLLILNSAGLAALVGSLFTVPFGVLFATEAFAELRR